MSDDTNFVSIRSLIEGCWPGEWGSDPIADNGNCMVLRATDIDSDGHLNMDGGASRSVLPIKLQSKALKLGDILLEASGGAPDKPVGRVALVHQAPHKTSLTSNFFRSIRPAKGTDPRFLTLQLVALNRSSLIWRYQQQTTGLINLKVDDYLNHKIWAPSQEKQQKIADIVFSIDTAIEKTEALIAKYQQIKTGLMHDLFTRGVLPNGQLRPFDKLVQTPFGEMPSEWHLGSILELTDSQRQPILTGPFGADLANADFVAEGVPVLRIGNVQQGRLDLEDLLHVSARKAATLSRYRIKEGDLLFARQGATTGRNALADERVEGCLINYHIIRVALDHGRCSPLFVEAAFANEIIKRQIERDKGRGTREGINTAQLTSLVFPVAPLAEQRLIAEILSKHNRFLRLAEAELQLLKMQKRGLMQDLLTGKVQVNIDTSAPEPTHA